MIASRMGEILLCFALGQLILISVQQTPDPPDPWGGMDAEERRLATARAFEIVEAAKAYDRAGGAYPAEFVQRLSEFYKDGVEADGPPWLAPGLRPGDPTVTRSICREIVLALMWDLFVGDPGEFQNRPDGDSATRFRGLLLELLDTTDADLSPAQEARLFRLVALAFGWPEGACEVGEPVCDDE